MDFGDFGDFGFWILDFGFWILGILDFGFWILGILDFGFWGRNPKSKIPQSKIQNPNFFGRFWGFWILDFGPLCSKSLCGPKFGGFWILDFGFGGFWILDLGDFGFWILDLGDFGFWILGILDFGFWGFWILDFGDFGFWILDRYVANLYVMPPTPQIWGILDFGFWGFWGFWILDFGVWGFWILDFGFCDKFWMLHKKRRLCTPNRVGGFCVDLKEFPRFFQNLSRDFHRRMVALAASGFNKKRALLDKALEEPGVGRRLLVLTLQDVLVYLVRFQQCGDSLNGPLEKIERVTLVLCAKCQISVGKRHTGLPFGKKCKQKTVYCCDGHCALGAHQPLGDGHTSARPGE